MLYGGLVIGAVLVGLEEEPVLTWGFQNELGLRCCSRAEKSQYVLSRDAMTWDAYFPVIIRFCSRLFLLDQSPHWGPHCCQCSALLCICQAQARYVEGLATSTLDKAVCGRTADQSSRFVGKRI